jgi:DNA-binding response OmpR family regulator
MSRPRILILADQPLAAALCEGLEGHGFRTETTAARDAALALAGAIGFAAAVVDRDNLGRRPQAALAVLATALHCPVCLLVRPGLRVKPTGIIALLPKPVRLQALAALLRTALRAGTPSPSKSPRKAASLLPLRNAGFDFDASARRLRHHASGTETVLTEIETHLFSMLLRTAGQAQPREDLLRDVWGYNSEVSTRTLETHIYRLRRKLEHGKGRATILETVPGGYRLALRGKEVRK